MGKGAETKGEHGRSVVGLAPPDGPALFRSYEKGYETGKSQGTVKGVEVGYEKCMAMGMEVGYEKGMSKGMEKGYEKGKSKGMKKGYEKGIEMGYEEGQAFDKGYFKGMGKGMEKGYGDGYDKGYEKGRGDGKSQGMEMGFEKGSESGYDRGYEKGKSKGMEMGFEKGSEMVRKGLGQGLRKLVSKCKKPSLWATKTASNKARSPWPRSPRPSSSEAELEEKLSPKPRPRLPRRIKATTSKATSAASKAKPKAASKGAPFTKARPLPKRDPNAGDLYQTRDEESETEVLDQCAECHAPVKRPLVVNWCPKCKACIHTDCLEAHYVRRHGEPFDHAKKAEKMKADSSHPLASSLLPPSMRPKPPASPPPSYLMKNADGA